MRSRRSRSRKPVRTPSSIMVVGQREHLGHALSPLESPSSANSGRLVLAISSSLVQIPDPFQEARLGLAYQKCAASIPSAAIKIPCACSWRTRPSAPALAESPFSDAPLQTNDMPDARARRARGPPSACIALCTRPTRIHLPLAQVGLPSAACHSPNGQRAERIELRDDEAGLQVTCRVVHLLGDRASPQHLPERVETTRWRRTSRPSGSAPYSSSIAGPTDRRQPAGRPC